MSKSSRKLSVRAWARLERSISRAINMMMAKNMMRRSVLRTSRLSSPQVHLAEGSNRWVFSLGVDLVSQLSNGFLFLPPFFFSRGPDLSILDSSVRRPTSRISASTSQPFQGRRKHWGGWRGPRRHASRFFARRISSAGQGRPGQGLPM